jgi:hypothetical protein
VGHLIALSALALSTTILAAAPQRELSVASYRSIQEAINANPGKQLFVPAGDYRIDREIEIRHDDSGLFGPGHIIQTNPGERIIYVVKANGVQLRDLTLTRAKGKQGSVQQGLLAEHCRDLVLDNLQVLENHGGLAIRISGCLHSQIRHCLVRNYTDFAVDDRTKPGEFGIAFNCMDGTGIQVDNSVATLVLGNRVIESRLIGTPELWKKHSLGKIVKRSVKPGTKPTPGFLQRDSVQNWHQGSAIHVSNPQVTDFTQLIGNYVENAGQGIDVHGDHTLISGNIINNAFIGMKAMHGSRNVTIIGNQFSKVDLWGILLQPGTASHAGHDATAAGTAQAPNIDGGTIVANNVITDFGFGNEYWNWRAGDCYPILIHSTDDPTIPPLRDVLVTGNVVYDTGRDTVVENGKLVKAGPRYKYAIYVGEGINAPRNVVIANNILNAGRQGASNVDLAHYRTGQ